MPEWVEMIERVGRTVRSRKLDGLQYWSDSGGLNGSKGWMGRTGRYKQIERIAWVG